MPYPSVPRRLAAACLIAAGACAPAASAPPASPSSSADPSASTASAGTAAQARLDSLADGALRYAAAHYLESAARLDPANGIPRRTQDDAQWKTVGINDWTSGFFPGTLWLLYEHTQNPALREQAERWTLPLADIPRGHTDHDLGFQFFSSFGNAYRITGEERFRPPMLQAARILAARFNPTVGAIKSWNSRERWPYPVIVDNMMNLELLFWTSRHGGDPEWTPLAVRHAETTMRTHIRPDGGSFHLVDFDSLTGAIRARNTVQGYADSSTWARGEAWLTYGYTMAYRETRDPRFLRTARRVADYALAHMPADRVPCWDYQAPGCAYRDASAGAITASALLELSTLVPGEDGARYRREAETALATLASPAYLSRGQNKPTILLHSVGHLPGNSEIDVGINYADYYFVEALLRYKALRGTGPAGVMRTRAALPRVFSRRAELLAEARARARCGDSAIAPAFGRLMQQAEVALSRRPESVIEKERIPPSGNKHDYVSLAPYWWPDPSKPDGLPYIRRDGEKNPETTNEAVVDDLRLDRTIESAEVLALAYYFTGQERFAAGAARVLRTFFIDPATRMNPNLAYGQAIPGVTEGRGIGIIETRRLSGLVDALGLLDSADAWTDADDAGMRAWMAGYLDWLSNSAEGLDEKAWYNNHGAWYDAQAAAIALYLGRDDVAREILTGSARLRINGHIRQDGSQPEELARTRSFSYSLFNLEAFSELAEMGRHVGIDLWNYRPAQGGGIHKALDYVAPYADPAVKWTGQQITPESPRSLVMHLARARRVYGDARYGSLLARIPGDCLASERVMLFYPAPAVPGTPAAMCTGAAD